MAWYLARVSGSDRPSSASSEWRKRSAATQPTPSVAMTATITSSIAAHAAARTSCRTALARRRGGVVTALISAGAALAGRGSVAGTTSTAGDTRLVVGVTTGRGSPNGSVSGVEYSLI